jgi:hypothetical protein
MRRGMLKAVISTTIEGKALAMSSIRLGAIPYTERTPDHYLIVSDEDGPAIRFVSFPRFTRHFLGYN